MELIEFRVRGRTAHFLRAEASASALSYPVPPRTAILGMLGAICGIKKDEPQIILEQTTLDLPQASEKFAQIAISGKIPQTHWHRVKLRKDPPVPLPYTVKCSQRVERNTAPEKATLILQEWLLNPDYTIWVSLPSPHHEDLKNRLKERRWHFSPSLGLSEMLADIEYINTHESNVLPEGDYIINTVFQRNLARLDMEQVFGKQLALHALNMPRTVTEDRIFSHCAYYIERDAKPVPVNTKHAYRVADKNLMFL
ncbi:MAG: type I-B CRISPR-associated protein Cas5b [Candidatus Eremiobacteraeota bacterium]|nr:type I-B CRISPR-associated protein Cas5b [Candidatus Eremiobacteraeota bacterium]